jgi:hypothetical protein
VYRFVSVVNNILGHHPQKTFIHDNRVSVTGLGILIQQSPVNGKICGEIS